MGCIPLNNSRLETEYDGRARRLWEMPEASTSEPALEKPEENLQRSTTVGYNGCNGSTTVYKCTPLYAESHTGNEIQEPYNGNNGHSAAKLFSTTTEESEPPPEDIHAKIDRELHRLKWDADDESAYLAVYYDGKRSELNEPQLLEYHHRLTTMREAIGNGKRKK
jgi:hypothetical protein